MFCKERQTCRTDVGVELFDCHISIKDIHHNISAQTVVSYFARTILPQHDL